MSEAARPSKILLKGDGFYEEGIAGGAITPGHLIALASGGTYVVHPTAGGSTEKAFAIEDALQGKTIADAYASTNPVRFVIAHAGIVIFALLADGENVAKGDKLSSKGTGALRKVTGSDVPVAVALEAIDLSASANLTDGRIRIRVL